MTSSVEVAPSRLRSLPSLTSVLVFISAFIIAFNAMQPLHDASYVPGAGFSGFWYTFGRVAHLPDNKKRDYYCFSAGCLVVSSVFLNRDYADVASTALEIQSRWKRGEISRYDVAGEFVDDLLELSEGREENGLLQDDWLKHTHVLTTSYLGFPQMRTASNRGELRKLLVKTSFIPFATGFGFGHEGENDGGFSLLFHPRCNHNIMLPVTWKMLKNVLNVNMGMDTVKELYEIGWEEEEAKAAKGRGEIENETQTGHC